jgi:hypothetical protein
MTVCAAALSENSKAIVCISDNGVSYGESIQWDSDSSKMFAVKEKLGPIIMFAGSEEPTSKVLAALLAHENEIGENIRKTVEICEREYKQSVDELVEAKFLTPRLLARKDYLAAISGSEINPYMRDVAENIDRFEMDSALIVCGFDSEKKAFILDLEPPGIVTDMSILGFHAIGTGSEKAISRLLFDEFRRIHTLERTPYDCFDAKANAEMAAGVGYAWDAAIITEAGIKEVPIRIKELIEKVWAKYTRSPFDKYDKKEHMPLPPDDWQDKLRSFRDSIMGPIFKGRSK